MTLPDELQGAVPRRVTLTPGGKASVLFFLMLAAAGITSGALLYAQAGRDAILHAHHVSESVSAKGEILTAEFVSGKHGRWEMTYKFSADGRVTGGHTTMSEAADSQPFAVGASVAISYMPSNPADNWAVGYEPAGVQFWLGPVVGVICILCAVIGLSGVRRRMNLLSHGRVAVARTTCVVKVFNRSRGGQMFRMMCEFRLPDDTRCVTSAQTRDARPPPPEVVIIYDPDKPDKAFLYPTHMVKVCGAATRAEA